MCTVQYSRVATCAKLVCKPPIQKKKKHVYVHCSWKMPLRWRRTRPWSLLHTMPVSLTVETTIILSASYFGIYWVQPCFGLNFRVKYHTQQTTSLFEHDSRVLMHSPFHTTCEPCPCTQEPRWNVPRNILLAFMFVLCSLVLLNELDFGVRPWPLAWKHFQCKKIKT